MGKLEKIDLDGIHRIQLEMMDGIHCFCMENGIRYSLSGGSLLGAVKYGGYVPLDDDIDIMMPRPDYERFISTYRTDLDYVMDLRESDSSNESFSKVCRKGTRLIDPLLGRCTFPVFVDVCPVDGAPFEPGDFFGTILERRRRVPKLCAFYKDVPRHKLLWFCKYALKRLANLSSADAVTLKKEIHRMLASHPVDGSPKAGELLVCGRECEILDSSIFLQYTEYDFEGRKYMGIKDSHSYLKTKYSCLGDYMDLPPLTKPMHEFEAYIHF